jgi:myo-inositol-1-phosphate synthase
LHTRRLHCDGNATDLTAREFTLVQMFLTHPGQVLSREKLLSHVWGYDYEPGSNIVETYIRYLRRKLGPDRIETVPAWATDFGTERLEGWASPSRRPPARTILIRNAPHPSRRGRNRTMAAVRVAIVGVGNCAASLVQGVHYYRDAAVEDRVPGLMHVKFGGYHVGDIQFVAAFDVDAKKVGLDLSQAIGASENNTITFADVPPLGVRVQRGPTLDGLGEYYRETIAESDREPVDVVAVLRENQVDVLVSYLPVGSEEADKFYAQCAIDAGVGFVNALPVFIASDSVWAQKFSDAGVPIVGDDIKSQVGATITHRVLAKLFEDRGVKLERTYQLNFGGNMDFKNMLERSRLKSKKISKTQAVTSQIPHEMRDADVHIGPSDFVPFLDDQKHALVRLEGRGFGDVPIRLEYKLEVWDSPNSAGIIIDALRACKIAMDRGMGGPVLSASSYFMKSPPVQYDDSTAREEVERFLQG